MAWYYWLIVIICALFSMFFSAADMVYGMVDKDRLNREKGKKEKRAQLAIRIDRTDTGPIQTADNWKRSC